MTDIEKMNELRAKAIGGTWIANGTSVENRELNEVHDCYGPDDAKWIAAIHNAWPEIAAELKVLADVRADLPRLYATAKEWQEYSEKIESETDAAMAEEIQRLRRECPKAINNLKDAELEIERLRERVAELEYDPRLSVHWIRKMAKLCEDESEKWDEIYENLKVDESRTSLIEANLAIASRQAYRDLFRSLEGWACSFDGQVQDRQDFTEEHCGEIERLREPYVREASEKHKHADALDASEIRIAELLRENNELRTQLRIQRNASRD